MDIFKTEVNGPGGQTTHVQTINFNYAGETFNQMPVMVELKTVPTTLNEEQRLQLFNLNSVQFNPVQGQIQYVTPKYMSSCAQTQTQDLMQENSESQNDDLPSVKREKPCQCHICGKRYANPKALKKHQVVHPEMVFEWQCRICNKTFPYKITMSRHVKLHAGEKLFKCENCKKRFETRYALVQHVKLHKSDVPFRCDLCDKPFLKSAEFSRHVRTHTGEKPFTCTVCGKSFTTKASFLKHSEKKHNLIL